MAIKRAYKIAIMKWHPDKNMDNVDEATEKIKSVVAAYECIGTAGARLNYGQALHAPSRLRLREARALGAMMCAWHCLHTLLLPSIGSPFSFTACALQA